MFYKPQIHTGVGLDWARFNVCANTV